MKARTAAEAKEFTDIPNIGPRMAADFRQLGLRKPMDLAGNDAYALYRKMCRVSGMRQDPCVLDTYMAAVVFMEGGKPAAWWTFTKKRKDRYPNL